MNIENIAFCGLYCDESNSGGKEESSLPFT